MLPFRNVSWEMTFNSRYISNVQIKFKEDFGTEGRGGCLKHYGIIRDVMQNYFMLVLALVAMEAPPTFWGPKVVDKRTNSLKR